jgi:hypothetical protein
LIAAVYTVMRRYTSRRALLNGQEKTRRAAPGGFHYEEAGN